MAIGHPSTLWQAFAAKGSKLAGQPSSTNLLDMRPRIKPSISSRTSVRGLIIACLPAAALGIAANSPVLGEDFKQPANQGLTVRDQAAASTNAPGTNGLGNTTNNIEQVPISIHGVRG